MLRSFRPPTRRPARPRVIRPAVDALEARELTAYAGIGVPSVRPPVAILFPVFQPIGHISPKLRPTGHVSPEIRPIGYTNPGSEIAILLG